MEFKKFKELNSNNFEAPPGSKDVMGEQAALPQARSLLEQLFRSYGLEFPQIDMADPKFKDKVVAIGKVAEIAKTNIKALEQMLMHTASLMAGQVKLADFYESATQIVVEGKKRIDRSTADAFLALAEYNKYGQYLAGKVERKMKALNARYELLSNLAEGKLKTSLQLLENQKQAGEKRRQDSLEVYKARQELLNSASVRRQNEQEYIKYGHLK
jgi:hypothetical protein